MKACAAFNTVEKYFCTTHLYVRGMMSETGTA